MNQNLLKPITEASYLTVENAWRYRAILRYFYEQHEKMRQYLYPEEVFDYLKGYEAFRSYTEDMLQSDLEQLLKWKNLMARQETGKVRTIEEFKKKRFRYQCSPYTVEIERMVKSLEKMGDSFGGSLEKTLFDRLYESLKKAFEMMKEASNNTPKLEDCQRAWEDIFDYFKKLIQNSADYIAYVNSENVEERMMTDAFLAYKDSFTEYLRDFIISLQQTSLHIELLLSDISEGMIREFIAKVAASQRRIPRLEELAASAEEMEEELLESWDSLKEWFLGRQGQESELQMLQSKTNETIRRMTRFAQRLGEKHHNFRSRKQDYLHLASWFAGLDGIDEAHKLSAAVFGVFNTKHLFAEEKSTEDIYRDIWEETPTTLVIKPRVRHYREKTKPTALADHRFEKEMVFNEYLDAKEKELALIRQYTTGNKIVFKDLPVIETSIRKTLLAWLGKALAKKDHTTKVETGQRIKIRKLDGELVTLAATDGVLEMPNFEIQFLDGE